MGLLSSILLLSGRGEVVGRLGMKGGGVGRGPASHKALSNFAYNAEAILVKLFLAAVVMGASLIAFLVAS